MFTRGIKTLGLSLAATLTLHNTNAQDNLPVTWMKGHNQISQPGIYGSINSPAATNTPGARYGAASVTLNNGKLLLFGGQGFGPTTSGGLNDTWLFDPATNNWAWVKGASATNQFSVYGTRLEEAATSNPGGRRTFAYATDAMGKLWIFGGLGYGVTGSSSTYQNDLWRYDPVTNNWTWIKGNNQNGVFASYGTQGIAAAGNSPGGRYGGMSWIDSEGNFWLFGGYGYVSSGSAGYLNDLWKYDVKKDEWVWMKGSNTLSPRAVYGTLNNAAETNTPGGRYGGGNYWSDAAGNFYLFGGYGYAAVIGYLNDLWKYSPSTNTWTWINGSQQTNELAPGVYGNKGIAAATNTPGGRRYPTIWKDISDNIWLSAGYGYPASGDTEGALNDVWKYNAQTNQWAWIHFDSTINSYGLYGTRETSSGSNKPGGRIGAVSWRDGQGNIWLLGGQGFAQSTGSIFSNMNDLWKLSLNLPPLVDSIKIYTLANAPALNSTHGGKLQLQAKVFPLTVNQSVAWSISTVTGNAVIDNNGLVTATGNGTVWVYAAALADRTRKDSMLLHISGQAVAGEPDAEIYPNPAPQKVYIRIKQFHPELRIILRDNIGRVLFVKRVTANTLTQPYAIDVSRFPAGLYFIDLKAYKFRIVKPLNKM